MNEKDIETLQKLIDNAKNIVFFGGAGVSTESGIRDFRSEDGLYALKSKYGYPYEVMLSHSFYKKNPDLFYQFYREFMIDTNAKPNDAHKFLAELEKKKNLIIVTQNIDGLHQKAGSKKVYELHGTIMDNHCERCHTYYPLETILMQSGVPRCPSCSGIIKPDVVLYEEPLNYDVVENAIRAISHADLLIIAGTSLSVYPAASYIEFFKGDNIVLINKTKVDKYVKVSLEINEPVGKVFSKLKC